METNSKTRVVNIRFEEFDVYIGRAGHGQDGCFGNPFNEPNRDESIKKFREYFYDRIKHDKIFRQKVQSLKGKTLGCFCRPKSCHGDIYVEYLENLPEPINLAVIGSRSFDNYEYMEEILNWFDIKTLISGGAKGADTLAKKYAAQNSIPYKEFLPQWDKFGKSAGYKRNIQIVNAADEIVAFWDGISKGTKHSIDIATEQGKPVHIFKFSLDLEIQNDDISILG